jgi:hypothetical protein
VKEKQEKEARERSEKVCLLLSSDTIETPTQGAPGEGKEKAPTTDVVLSMCIAIVQDLAHRFMSEFLSRLEHIHNGEVLEMVFQMGFIG